MSLGVLLLFLASNEAAEGTFFLRPRVVRERLAAAEEMILTSNGRPMAVIMYVDDEDDPEDVLNAAREARSQIALRRIRERARRTGADKLSSPEIDDAPLAECARALECPLVSGNARHFPSAAIGSLAILTPRQFVDAGENT